MTIVSNVLGFQFFSLARDPILANETDREKILTTLSEKFEVSKQGIQLDLENRMSIIDKTHARF